MAKKKKRTELEMISYLFGLGYVEQAQARLDKYMPLTDENRQMRGMVVSKIKKGYI